MQINKSRNNKTYKRVQRRCSLSLAKQHSSLSDPLCFCHSLKAGSKTELLNQRLGNTPGFQAQAVKGPLCPLQSFTGTADSRSETAFQASLVSVKSPLHSRAAPWRGFSPYQLCWRLGSRQCAPRARQTSRLPNFPFMQPAGSQEALASLYLRDFSCTSFNIWKRKIPVRRRN